MTIISQRDAFWKKIYQMATYDKDIVVISADMGAPALDDFRRDFPHQFLNVGIAEQNAILVGSGLILAKKKVFAYAISSFITLNCLEKIKVENSLMGIPLTIVGVGAGFSYPDSGPTHHSVEDLAIMRSLPGIGIYNVSDSFMASTLAEKMVTAQQANYIRLDREALPALYPQDADFSQGFMVLKDHPENMLVATGIMVHVAQDLVNKFASMGIEVGIIDAFQFPLPEEALLKKLKNVKRIATLEEHFLVGGLGSALCEIFNDAGWSKPIKRMGLLHSQKYCYQYGGREALRKYYGLDFESLMEGLSGFFSSGFK